MAINTNRMHQVESSVSLQIPDNERHNGTKKKPQMKQPQLQNCLFAVVLHPSNI